MAPLRTRPPLLAAALLLLAAAFAGGSIRVSSLRGQVQGAQQCNDGVDNDGDGLVDWVYDLGCTSVTDASEGGKATGTLENGWTVFEPSADSRVIYVSDSEGLDANSGLSPATPVKTVTRGVALLRDGYPDWLLFKRGDTWTDQGFGFSQDGRSASEPLVIGSYGASTQRPQFNTGVGGGIAFSGGGGNTDGALHVSFVGLSFSADKRNPASPRYTPGTTPTALGMFLVHSTFQNVHVEDCVFRHYQLGMSLQQWGSTDNPRTAVLRRNIIADNFSNGSGHSQGIFFEGVNSLLVEENVFDMNGWHPTVPGAQKTMFNHSVYGTDNCSGVVFRHNILARTSLHNLMVRGGVTAENNFLTQGTYGGVSAMRPSVWQDNVITDLLAYTPSEGGEGIIALQSESLVMRRDIFAHKPARPTAGWGGAINLQRIGNTVNYPTISQVNQTSTDISDNIMYHWSVGTAGTSTSPLIGFNTNVLGTLTFQGNALIDQDGGILVGSFNGSPAPAVSVANGNRYVSPGRADRQVYFGNAWTTIASWMTSIGEENATMTQPSYPDPTRTAASFNASLGGSASLDGFLTRARTLSKWNWDPRFTADGVNDYMREGFGMTPNAYEPQGSFSPPPAPPPASSAPSVSSSSVVSSASSIAQQTQACFTLPAHEGLVLPSQAWVTLGLSTGQSILPLTPVSRNAGGSFCVVLPATVGQFKTAQNQYVFTIRPRGAAVFTVLQAAMPATLPVPSSLHIGDADDDGDVDSADLRSIVAYLRGDRPALASVFPGRLRTLVAAIRSSQQ